MRLKNIVSALFAGLLALASASAATIVFNVTGTLALGGQLSGTITIDNTLGVVTAQNITLGPPLSLACTSILTQFAFSGAGYIVLLQCGPGQLDLLLPSNAAGDLLGYIGGPIGPASFFVIQTNTVNGGALTPIGLGASDPAFQVRYAANLNVGESYIDIINDGANGAPLLGPGFGTAAGNICVNVYAFSPDEQLISCCSCLVTPNGLVHLGVNADLTSKTLTGVIPTSVVVKLVSTLAGAGGAGTSCTNSAATATLTALGAAPVAGGTAPGTVAWGTTLHPQGAASITTETPFTPATLSAGELASITGRCGSILGNGSGFGICNSCKAGGLGAGKK
jgi:hypothetical protein